jgi:hypothetical protein
MIKTLLRIVFTVFPKLTTVLDPIRPLGAILTILVPVPTAPLPKLCEVAVVVLPILFAVAIDPEPATVKFPPTVILLLDDIVDPTLNELATINVSLTCALPLAYNSVQLILSFVIKISFKVFNP